MRKVLSVIVFSAMLVGRAYADAILDDLGPEFTKSAPLSDWTEVTTNSTAFMSHAWRASDDDSWAEFSFSSAPAGQYDISIWFPVLTSGLVPATAVPAFLTHSGGIASLTVNMDRPFGGMWNPIGRFTLDALSKLRLTGGGNGKYFADAVRLVPVPVPPPVSPFAVGMNPSATTGGMNASGLVHLQELKPHSLRIGWRQGNYQPNVDFAVANNMSFIFGFGDDKGGAGLPACDVTTTVGRQCWADRAATVVGQLGSNQAKYYSVWNEWNGLEGPYPTQAENNARFAEYTDLLCKTHAAVRAVRPEAQIAGGVIAGSNPGFLADILSAGAGACMEVLDLHLYVYRQGWPGHVQPGDPASVAVDRFIEVIDQRAATLHAAVGFPMKIIVSEAGFHGVDNEVLDGPRMGAYVQELYSRTRVHPHLAGVWWFKLRQHIEADGGLNQHGLVRPDDSKRQPAFDNFKAAAAAS